VSTPCFADKTGHYEVALDRFCHYLALVETDPSATVVSEMRATLTCNVGACLHQMGQVEAAIDYYERALQEFKAIPFSIISRVSLTWVLYGNLVNKRVEYVEKKLTAIRAGEPADPASYQDGFGKTRKWSKEEMEGKTTWSWVDPRTWFGYGRLQEVGIAGQETPGQVNSAANAA
jgi:tetratricopeptide (TPR) repeat protein